MREVLEFCASHGGEEAFREMIAMDAVMANTDRHAGNYGFLVDNDTGEPLGMAPLFDHNMAFMPAMTEGDDREAYLRALGPKIGTDFIGMAKRLLTSNIRGKLVSLRSFSYEDPGFGYPAWKLDAANWLKERQVSAILG